MERDVRLLNNRERRILELLADGYTHTTISSIMHLTEQSVRKHIDSMLQKQGFVSPYQLINWAYRESIIS